MSSKILLYISGLSITLTACSGLDGDWPKFNTPLPERAPIAREKHQADPVRTQKPSYSIADETESITDAVRQNRLAENLQAFAAALADYQQIFGDVEAEQDPEEQLVLWRSAQLYLTRASRILTAAQDDCAFLSNPERGMSPDPSTCSDKVASSGQTVIDARAKLQDLMKSVDN